MADVADVDARRGGHRPSMRADRFVARGVFNPRPALCCRILTWTDEPDRRGVLRRRRIDAALGRTRARRRAPSESARLVWSEADGLPGLVVDRYGPVVVIQCVTLGMARVGTDVVAALRSRLGDVAVLTHGRRHDGRPGGLRAGGGLDRSAGPGRRRRGRARRASGRARRAAGTRPVSISTRPTTEPGWRTRSGPAQLSTSSPTPGASPVTLSEPARRRAVCVESSPDAGRRRAAELRAERLLGTGRGAAGQRVRRAAPARSRPRAVRSGRARSPALRPWPDRAGGRAARLQGDQPARAPPAVTRRAAGDVLLLAPRGRGRVRAHVCARPPTMPGCACGCSSASARPPTTRCC